LDHHTGQIAVREWPQVTSLHRMIAYPDVRLPDGLEIGSGSVRVDSHNVPGLRTTWYPLLTAIYPFVCTDATAPLQLLGLDCRWPVDLISP